MPVQLRRVPRTIWAAVSSLTQIAGTNVSLAPKAMLKLFVTLVAVALVVMAAWGAANFLKNRARAAAAQAGLPGSTAPSDVFEVEA